jgi:hypothetical protein
MSDLNNITAADALTLFTEFQRQNPGRLDGAINSGSTGDDFVFGGRDTLTGETVYIRATSDADVNYVSFYSPYTEQIRSGFFDGQLPYNPDIVTLPPAVFTPLTYFDSGSVFGNSFNNSFGNGLNSFSSGFSNGSSNYSVNLNSLSSSGIVSVNSIFTTSFSGNLPGKPDIKLV